MRNKNIVFRFTGNETKYLNLGSYNYLGFAQSTGPCAYTSVEALVKYGCATASIVKELGMKYKFLIIYIIFLIYS